MYWAESLLNANVVVEHTQGRLNLIAVSLPQKQAESVTSTSGCHDSISCEMMGSRMAVMRNDCTLISVVDTSRSLRSLLASSAGR